jgi:hypothetical protein
MKVHTVGMIFPDDSILDLIRIPSGELRLLMWDGKSASAAEQFVKNGKTYLPPREDSAILRSVRLPAKTADYGSTSKLFNEIFLLIASVTRTNSAFPLAFFVFATWLTDCFDCAPHVWIVAPPTTPASPLIQLLGLLCRRTIFVTDISSAALHSLPIDVQPTILTSIFEPTRRILNILRTSSRHGISIAAGCKATDNFGANIVFAPEPLRAPASAGFPLEVALFPINDYIPMKTQFEAETIAQEFQPKLLQYRLVNRAKVRAPAFDLSQFTAPMQELGYSLASSIVGDDALQSKIVPYLKPLDSEIRIDRTFQLPAIVLEALLALCHRTRDVNFPVGELTVDVNNRRCGRGDQVSPEQVGWALRALGLRTEYTAGGRRGLVLSESVCKRIHDLAAAHGVRTLHDLSPNIKCPLCVALAEGKPESNPVDTVMSEPRESA